MMAGRCVVVVKLEFSVMQSTIVGFLVGAILQWGGPFVVHS